MYTITVRQSGSSAKYFHEASRFCVNTTRRPRTLCSAIVIRTTPLFVFIVKHGSAEWAVVGGNVLFGSGVFNSATFASLLRFLNTAIVASKTWFCVR